MGPPPHVCEAVDTVSCSWYFLGSMAWWHDVLHVSSLSSRLCGGQSVCAHSACGHGAERMSWELVGPGHRPRPNACLASSAWLRVLRVCCLAPLCT